SARYILIAGETPEAVTASIYRELKAETATARLFFESVRSERMEVIIRDPVSSSTFFRAFGPPRPGLDVPLPPGVYEVTAHLFPAVARQFLSVTPGSVGECVFKDAPRAALHLKLRDGTGAPVPGKITAVGLGPTPTPYFAPDDPVESGRGWERFKNHVFPAKDGAEVELPAGTYLLTASCGPEHTIAQRTVALLEGERREVVLVIDRAFATPGLVSLDPHLHTRFSDGSNTVADRVRSIAAEGVDVAVATDHNFVTDYRPALAELGLEDELAVLAGTEVTAPENYIHFNVYPLEPAPAEDGNGAISALGGSPEALFQAALAKPGSFLRQVNHPRAGSLGYFNNYELDKETAGSAATGFSADFDVMEAMNGPVFDRGNDQAIADWLHLLNRGFFFPIVGSSDTHAIDGEEPGYSRTYVRYAGGEGRALDAEALLAAVRAGRSFVSNGPVVALKVGGRAEPGDTLTARGGKVAVEVEVRGAPWFDVDEVALIINGEPGLVFPVAHAGGAVLKFRQRVELNLARDAYIVCEASGRRPLYPVLQVHARTATDAALPYALTNPVFVDVDGNGRYDAPLPREIRTVGENPYPETRLP
ncbi:MAG: PHP domain-containing protein, partial [Candidatus Aminicenantes bacterium]|nr:PHP domain-containing protein [Candidatus Aminicenantes bacterium]